MDDKSKIVAVKIYTFPVDNDNFIFVERIVAEEKSITGGRTVSIDIPNWSEEILEKELHNLLSNRKENNPHGIAPNIALIINPIFITISSHTLSLSNIFKYNQLTMTPGGMIMTDHKSYTKKDWENVEKPSSTELVIIPKKHFLNWYAYTKKLVKDIEMKKY